MSPTFDEIELSPEIKQSKIGLKKKQPGNLSQDPES